MGEIQEAAQGENQLETNTPATGASQLTASYSVKRMITFGKKKLEQKLIQILKLNNTNLSS